MAPINEQSRWRVELGRLVGEAYARNPNVAAVLIAGSSARGHADRWSGIELMVARHQPPSDAERRRIVEPLAWDAPPPIGFPALD